MLLLFKIILEIFGTLHFYTNCKTILLILTSKNPAKILIEIILINNDNINYFLG